MNMPKLRFKADNNSDFPEWKSMSLDIACEINPETESLADQFYYIDLRSIDNGQWIEPKLLQKSSAPSRARRVATEDDVFFQSVRPYNKGHYHFTQYRDNQVVASTGFIQARMRNGSNSFLYHLFFSDDFNKKVTFLCSGSNYPAINSTEFGKIVVSLPSAQEQCKIAECLDSVDKVIEKQQAEVAAWEQYKKGVAQKLFSQEVRFKAEDGSNFPNWEYKTLGELGSFQKGAPLSKAAISDNGTPLILYGELYTTYKEIAYDIVRRTEKKVEPKFLSHIGDVLIPTSGETAEDISTATCVMQEGVILGSDLLIYRPVPWLDGRILSYVINHQVKQAISRVAQGPQVVHIKAKDISKIKAYVPTSPEEQRKIVECLGAIDDVIALSKAELEKWRELKKGLLQQLFV